jgi:hypothetical protein
MKFMAVTETQAIKALSGGRDGGRLNTKMSQKKGWKFFNLLARGECRGFGFGSEVWLVRKLIQYERG